ncbi:hypothetical protein HY837_02210 [archaeon]|nr:hypothetical protein [archaeon]
MSFEIKDPTFSWVEWLCFISFSIGLILALVIKTTFMLLLAAFVCGAYYGRVINDWEDKSKIVGILMMISCAAGFLIVSFNTAAVLLIVVSTKITYLFHKNGHVKSIEY